MRDGQIDVFFLAHGSGDVLPLVKLVVTVLSAHDCLGQEAVLKKQRFCRFYERFFSRSDAKIHYTYQVLQQCKWTVGQFPAVELVTLRKVSGQPHIYGGGLPGIHHVSC